MGLKVRYSSPHTRHKIAFHSCVDLIGYGGGKGCVG